jgi:hypothetical protein
MTRELLKKYLVEQLIENILDEDYPTTWNLEEFKQLRGFAARVKYCDTHLQKIKAGSGRIAYKIDNEKVLKLAKNQKGVAQNEVEAQYGNDWYFEGILAKTFEVGPDNLWIEMELARKVTPTIWKKHFGYDIDTIGTYLKIRFNEVRGQRYPVSLDPAIMEQLHENDDVKSLFEFADATDSVADLARLSTYGLVNRDGNESIVIIDYGLTGAVYDSYYA